MHFFLPSFLKIMVMVVPTISAAVALETVATAEVSVVVALPCLLQNQSQLILFNQKYKALPEGGQQLTHYDTTKMRLVIRDGVCIP